MARTGRVDGRACPPDARPVGVPIRRQSNGVPDDPNAAADRRRHRVSVRQTIRQSISALRESLPNATLVVLGRQEHNAMEAGRELLANAIMKFAPLRE